MKKILKILIPIILISLFISACAFQETKMPSNRQLYDQPIEKLSTPDLPVPTMTVPTADQLLNNDNYEMLGEDAQSKYFGKNVIEDYLLYSMNRDNLSVKQIAIFPPMVSGDLSTQNRIVDFGICGDWIIVSIGHYEGSGHYFYGNFARMKKDGSEFEHFWLTDNDTFVIVEDWIYYNFWTLEDKPGNVYGCYRIHPDGTGKEYIGDKIYSIIQYADDGYIYGEYDTGKTVFWNPITDLIRCKPDGSGKIILFEGSTLPQLDEADYISYYNITVENDFVTFTASVHGYREGDSWRGHNIYEAKYRVIKDGSGLTLLSDSYNSK